MAMTPVEVRHLQMRRGVFGYRKSSVNRAMDDIADSFEAVWRERAELYERVEALEAELDHHLELEELLRSTLVAAERAAQEMRETARREAEVILNEANAQSRRVLRDAIAEKERILGEVRRVRAILRSALTVVDEAPDTGAGEVTRLDEIGGAAAADGAEAHTDVHRLAG